MSVGCGRILLIRMRRMGLAMRGMSVALGGMTGFEREGHIPTSVRTSTRKLDTSERKGMRQIRSDLRYTPWPRKFGIRRIWTGPEFDSVLNHDGGLETRSLRSAIGLNWKEVDAYNLKFGKLPNTLMRTLKSEMVSSYLLMSTVLHLLGQDSN